MACGLELRAPFLDHRLGELCFALGVAGQSTLKRPKAVLRDAAELLFPAAPFQREKQGFALPCYNGFNSRRRLSALRGLALVSPSFRANASTEYTNRTSVMQA